MGDAQRITRAVSKNTGVWAGMDSFGWVTAREAAALLGVSVSTVNRMGMRGELFRVRNRFLGRTLYHLSGVVAVRVYRALVAAAGLDVAAVVASTGLDEWRVREALRCLRDAGVVQASTVSSGGRGRPRVVWSAA